jgi:hypothetical protein
MSQAETSVHDFEFTLEGADELTAEISDAIYEAGCDDASLSGCGPILSLSFHREAASYDEAVASARADVARTGLGLAVTRVARLTTFSFDVVLSGVSGVTAGMADAFVRGGATTRRPGPAVVPSPSVSSVLTSPSATRSAGPSRTSSGPGSRWPGLTSKSPDREVQT